MVMIAKSFKELISTLLPDTQQEQYFQYCQKPLKKSLTVNPVKINSEQFEQYAHEQWWTLEKHKFLEESYSYYIDRDDTSIALGNHWMHQCGFFYIQEIAASTPAYLLELSSHALVLDIAASPGGKTSQLANNWWSWLVIANDIDTLRIRTLSENLRRMGCRNTATSKLDGMKRGEKYPELFDAVLVDAPCSGEGTGFKSDDALTHRRIEEIKKIAWLQEQILRSAIHTCKVWGEIIYSTCTLNTLENEWVLAKILDEFVWIVTLEQISCIGTEKGYILPWLDREQCNKVARFWPHIQKTGGFFVSKLKKIDHSTISLNKDAQKKHTSFYGTHQSPEVKRVKQLLKEYYGIVLDPKRFLLFMQGDICFVTSPLVLDLPIQNISTGIALGKLLRDTRVPTHHLGNCLGHLATKNIIDITANQAQEYVSQEELTLELHTPSQHPFYLLQRNGKGIGTVKYVQGTWKSKFA
jgi:16S rRNA (cytosine1407-C5)-methyltransferase